MDTPPEEASGKSQSEPVAEPVAVPAEWAAGTIAVVSHGAVGGIAVIHADGSQIQPIVSADGAGVLSLNGSAIPVPYVVAPLPPATSQTIPAPELQGQAALDASAAGGKVCAVEPTAAEEQRTSEEASAGARAAQDEG